MICIPVFPRKKLSKQYKAVEQDVTSGEFLKSSEHIVLTKFFNHLFENDMAQICYCTITEEKRPKMRISEVVKVTNREKTRFLVPRREFIF